MMTDLEADCYCKALAAEYAMLGRALTREEMVTVWERVMAKQARREAGEEERDELPANP